MHFAIFWLAEEGFLMGHCVIVVVIVLAGHLNRAFVLAPKGTAKIQGGGFGGFRTTGKNEAQRRE